MDGYEVARRLRNNPNLKEVKLIAGDRIRTRGRPASASTSWLRLSLGQACRFTKLDDVLDALMKLT